MGLALLFSFRLFGPGLDVTSVAELELLCNQKFYWLEGGKQFLCSSATLSDLVNHAGTAIVILHTSPNWEVLCI